MNQKKTILAIAVLGATFVSQPVAAIGANDIFSVIFEVGGKVVGAAVDKAVDSMTDHEAERKKRQEAQEASERQLAAALQEQMTDIENQPSLTPYQKEKARIELMAAKAQIIAMNRFASSMIEQQEAARRAERDQLFSLGGLASATAGAALNTPSMVMAQADLQVKAGIPQAHSRNVMASIDNQGNLTPSGQMKQVVGEVAAQQQAATIAGKLEHQQGAAQVADLQAQHAGHLAEVEAARSEESANTSPPKDVFTADKGKAVYLEFVGCAEQAGLLHSYLKERGHQLVEQAEDAEVRYRIEGEYWVPATHERQGILFKAAEALVSPSPLPLPETTLKGNLASFSGKLFGALAGGAAVPVKPPSTPPSQYALVVLSRQQGETPDSIRFSGYRKESGSTLDARELTRAAIGDLYASLGLPREMAWGPEAMGVKRVETVE